MACWRKAPPFSASRSRSTCCSRPCAARSMRRGRRDGVRVLIVEDDPELAGLLRDGLRAQRIDPTLAATVGEGRDRAALSSYDVIILDVRLPGGSGFELCGELRRGGVTTPVLMLTALDAVDDRVRGLEVGADDYLTKPFAFRELVARLKALTRRRPALSPARYRIADLEVDLGTRQVHRRGQPITLSAKEFGLLELFVLDRKSTRLNSSHQST